MSESEYGNSAGRAAGVDVVAELLDDVRCFVRRYVVLTDAQADAIALWVAHTHAFAAAETTPYLEISSAEKQSGKTRLLETLEHVVATPWLTARISVSVLARKVDAEQPTLLLDESDAALAADKTYVQELRGVLNSGFRQGGKCTINVPAAQNGWTPTNFSVFCPKAIAGIGSLPDTVVSRSISIRLERKRPNENVEKLRLRRVTALAEPLRTRLESVLPDAVEALRELTEAEPALPEGLSDRAEDVWEPLVAIADLAGGDWPERARRAALHLSAQGREDEDSLGVQLLRDMKAIFDERNVNEISSSDLVLALNAIEGSPWGGWAHERGLSTHSLAKQLRRYRIKPRHLRDGSARGYSKGQFDEVFSRYLPPSSSESVKASDSVTPAEEVQPPPRRSGAGFDSSGERPEPQPDGHSDDLTVRTEGAGSDGCGDGGGATTVEQRPEDQAYADDEYERLQQKFSDLFGSGS